VKGGVKVQRLAGPHLTAIVAYMKRACHCSYSTIRKFLCDVIGVAISRGQLSKLVQKAATALEQAYNELLGRLPDEATLFLCQDMLYVSSVQ